MVTWVRQIIFRDEITSRTVTAYTGVVVSRWLIGNALVLINEVLYVGPG